MRALLLATVAALLAGPAVALDIPAPVHEGEPQMRRQVYNPAGRTLIVGTLGRSVVLTFAPEEQIKRVIFGDEETWEGPTGQQVAQSPLGNNLPLWPKRVGRTTLQVVTARAGGQPDRVYQFSAVVRDLPRTCGPARTALCDDDPEATYGLAFSYPEDERLRKLAEAEAAARERAARFQAGVARRQHTIAVARLQQDFTCVNGLYEGLGDEGIKPDDACDDGQQIGLLFRGNRQLPAVFLVDPSDIKKEQSVRATTRGDWLIIPMMRERVRLRIGERQVFDVVNTVFNQRGQNPGTGTTSPDVIREVVQARSP